MNVSELQVALGVTGAVFLVLVGMSVLVVNEINEWWGWLMGWVCVFISAGSFLACAWIPVFV